MKIKILGPGCWRCKELEANAKQAVKELGRKTDFEKVTEIDKIIEHGVMSTPALIIDKKVVSAGKILSVEEIKRLLE